MAVNLATKYVKQLDSKYAHKSICKQAFGASYDFTGVQTVKIYTLLGADLGDYTMSGTSRYGTATEVEDTVQELTVTRDRAVTKSIDKKNYKQGMLKTTVGAFVKVQQETKNIPEMDTYALAKLSAVATAAGNKDTTTATSA
ncbi:MAG: hypothetical protein GY787_32235, partial [Alteromonadales bacterium]|nr:hypothetical protein [Alteromonadales bacterium]